FDYCEVVGVGMFLEETDPRPKEAVHLVWAGEKVKASYPLPSPSTDQRIELTPGHFAVELRGLLCMKLMSYRDQDRLHIRDMIDVGLVNRNSLQSLPAELATRLEELLAEMGQ